MSHGSKIETALFERKELFGCACFICVLRRHSSSRVRSGSNLQLGNDMRKNSVKAALKAGLPQVGTWLSLGNVFAARLMARVGFPWLTVDLEHSPIGWDNAGQLFGAVADAGVSAWCESRAVITIISSASSTPELTESSSRW